MAGTRDIYDFAVIGAGIAGASVACELARDGKVVLIEAEPHPGYHTTGRSAAMFAPGYGPAPVRALTRASAAFFDAPPDGFAAHPLLTPRDVVMLATSDQIAALDILTEELSHEIEVERLDADTLQDRIPLLRPGYAVAGLLDRSGSDIDVHALHQGYLRQFRDRSGTLVTRAEVTGLTRRDGAWRINAGAEVLQAGVTVNAAGAWADRVGALAGAGTVGLVPKRRTAMMIDAPAGFDHDAMPLVVDIDEAFYLKPNAGRLLISPANEDPMQPCDVQPEELDIALCIDRIERAFELKVQRIGQKWAGLRSFVADKSPVAGFSTKAESFFWLAGQGGYGIQMAPALGRLAAALARGQAVPQDILAAGLDPASVSPDRLS